jgi:outer membrane autotransporter protein
VAIRQGLAAGSESRDRFRFGLGLGADLDKGLSLGLGYDASLAGGGSVGHSFSGRASMRF